MHFQPDPPHLATSDIFLDLSETIECRLFPSGTAEEGAEGSHEGDEENAGETKRDKRQVNNPPLIARYSSLLGGSGRRQEVLHYPDLEVQFDIEDRYPAAVGVQPRVAKTARDQSYPLRFSALDCDTP
jgi:hypothetical protein